MGVEDNTLLIFTSDNGPAIFGGADSAYFHSTEGRRGLKHDLYEGGIREPQIVRWPGHVKEGTQTPFITALYDWAPTWAELAGTPMNKTDGLSLLPALEGKTTEREGYLYFEHAPKGGQRAVRQGKWKAVWIGLKENPNLPGALYDLDKDPAETTDLSAANPQVMADLTKIRDASHVPTTIKAWNF
jgi:arylsulfatase A